MHPAILEHGAHRNVVNLPLRPRRKAGCAERMTGFGLEERHPEHDAAVHERDRRPAAPDTPNDVNATTTAASTTPTPCGVIEIMANNVATT